ncbi:MAG: NADH-quinone oxidoreductase subunit J [Thermoplasmata archaeon]
MVEAIQVIFIIVSAVEVVTSLLVVTAKKLMWAAFWLAITLVTMAGIYILFRSEFVAVIQILVYAGAVPVVFLFGIMLTRTRMMEEVP